MRLWNHRRVQASLASFGSASRPAGFFGTTIPDGPAGTAQTIRYAKRLIAQGLKDPVVRRTAVDVLAAAGVASHDEPAEVEALYQFVNPARGHFFFRKDTMQPDATGEIVPAEMLQPVRDMLATRSGDCDCLNLVLLPALLASVGYATRAITIAADPEDPGNYSHVYLEAQLSDGAWIPLDVARPDAAFGVAPEPGRYWDPSTGAPGVRTAWPLTAASNGTGGTGNRGQGIGRFLSSFRPGDREVAGNWGAGADPYARAPGAQGRRALGVFHAINGGLGRLAPMGALGQDDGGDGSIWANLIQAAPAIESGAAQIARAVNTPAPIYPYGSTALSPYGTAATPGITANLSSSSGLLLGIGIVALIVMMMGRRS